MKRISREEFDEILLEALENGNHWLGHIDSLTENDAYEIVSESDRLKSMAEILNEDLYAYASLNNYEYKVANLVWKSIVDINGIVNRDDNMLRHDGFNRLIARCLLENGHPVDYCKSKYGWEDWDFKTNCEPVAVFNVKHEYWEEFDGTFVGCSSHDGISGIVVFSDGDSREYRYECNIPELMKSLSSLENES